MKIYLQESEIQEALVSFMEGQNIDLSGKEVTVTLTAGRGQNGHSATIEIIKKKTVVSEIGDDLEETDTGSKEDDQAIKFDFVEGD